MSLHLGSVDYTKNVTLTAGQAVFTMVDDGGQGWRITVVSTLTTPLPTGQIDTVHHGVTIYMHSTPFGTLTSDLQSHTQFNLTIYYTGNTVTSYDGSFTSQGFAPSVINALKPGDASAHFAQLEEKTAQMLRQFEAMVEEFKGVHRQVEDLRRAVRPENDAGGARKTG